MKNRVVAIMLAATMLMGLGACSPEAKATKQIELGQGYMQQQDYQAAIEAYEAAIELDKYAIGAYEGLIVALSESGSENVTAVANNAVAAFNEMTNLSEQQTKDLESFFTTVADVLTNVDDAAAVLENGANLLGKDSAVGSAYEEALKNQLNHYMEGNNLKEAVDAADKLASEFPSDETSGLVQEATDKAESEQALVDILLQAEALIKAQDWNGLAEFSSNEGLQVIKDKVGDVGNYTYIFGGGTTGKGIGYYSMEGCTCDEWYYGDYVDGKRSGNGGWYWATTGTDGNPAYYNFEGEFADDAPNGYGVQTNSYSGVKYVYSGTYINGLEHGTMSAEFTKANGMVVTATYEMVSGKPVALDMTQYPEFPLPQDGYIAYAMFYDENGETNTYFSMPEGTVKGVSHFAH